MKNLFLEIYPNTIEIETGLLISIIAIVLVFLVLAIIIAAVSVMQFIFIKKNLGEKEEQVAKVENKEAPKQVAKNTVKNIEILDDDMRVAVLVATIDYANETKKDVRLVSIKQIG